MMPRRSEPLRNGRLIFYVIHDNSLIKFFEIEKADTMSLYCRRCGAVAVGPYIQRATSQDARPLKAFWGSFTGAQFTSDELEHVFVVKLMGADGASRIIGAVEALPCGNSAIYLCRLKVANGFRRQGLGALLVDAVLGEAKQCGCTSVFVVTKCRPEAPSVRLMQRFGALCIAKNRMLLSVPSQIIERYNEKQNFFWQLSV